MTVTANKIRSRSNPGCCVCGARGEPLYQRLRDRLLDALGEWNLKKYPDPQCGLVWLDPGPIEDDIGKAYQAYYTHADSDDVRHSRGAKECFRTILNKSWHLFLHATPIYGEYNRLNLMYLDKDKPGWMLEVACCNGRRLAEFRTVGWQAGGLEVDLKAVKTVQQTLWP